MTTATENLKRKEADRQRIVVLRYGELFLKGRNRPHFEQVLRDNVRRALARVTAEATLERGQGRLFVNCPATTVDAAARQLQRVFGISSLSVAIEVPRDLEAMGEVALDLVKQHMAGSPVASFRVKAKRSDKTFPFTSPEIGREVGARIFEGTELAVDLTSPQLVVGVEVGPHRSFVFIDRLSGAGGLPVGVSGDVALLLSGGIDSPVAGHLMQKRGCRVHPVYLHSFPYTGERTRDKVTRLAALLAPAQATLQLRVVPFTEIQLAIRDNCPLDLAVVLYRRMMFRIASAIAHQTGCLALATGENLGQVASQTLENMACIEQAATLPVLRPLLTHDKAETVELARQIGSYELSIEPYDDCCSLFVPKHPETRARSERVKQSEEQLDIPHLVEQAVAAVEVIPVVGE